MTTNFKYVQAQDFFLSGSGSIIGATSITLKSFKAIDGTTLLTMSDFGTIGFATIEPGNGIQEEQISFTGVTQNSNGTATLTGVKTVLFVNPYTATAGTVKTHAGSTTLIITNTSGFYDQFPAKNNDETIEGDWTFNGQQTFTNFPITPATQLATEAIAGFVKLSVAADNVLDPIVVGTNDDRVPVGYAADAVGTDSYAITPTPAETAYVTGKKYTFKAGVANTGACSLNVSALGAKTIKKDVSADLATNDILAGQIVECIYDGTNMQMVSTNVPPLASLTVKGVVEQATPTELNAGTAAGATGAQLFANPADITPAHSMGALSNTIPKTYFNMQLPFTLWTGSTAGALTTDFVNWIRNSSDVYVTPLGSAVDFQGTGSDTIYLDSPLITAASTNLTWGSTNTTILDFWAKLPATGTGDVQMGFTNTSSMAVAYDETTNNRVTFAQRGSTGVIYACITKATVGGTQTDVSAGITVTNWNNYRIEFTGGTDAKFYINGTLVATLSGANLPSSNQAINISFGRSNTNLFLVTAPTLSMKMNP